MHSNVQASHSPDGPDPGYRTENLEERLLHAPLTELEGYLSTSRSDSLSVQMWEALRERSVGKLQDPSLDPDIRLRWAEMANATLGRKHAAGGTDRVAAAADEARLRAYTIQEFGSSEDGGLQDTNSLIDLVFESLTMTREQVATAAIDWRTSDRAEILKLRRVKNLLNPLKQVVHLLDANDSVKYQVEEWLALIPRLP